MKFSSLSPEQKKVWLQRLQLYGGIALIFLLCAGFLRFYNIRLLSTDGIMPTPRSTVSPLEIAPVYQDDPSWADEKLSQTGFTMGQEGSLFACLSMCLNNLDIEATPDSIYSGFWEENLFIDGKIVDLPNIDNLYPVDFVSPKTFDGKTVTNLLKKGTPVMLQTHKDGSAFWVLVVGCDSYDFLVLSPLSGSKLEPLSTFGNVYAMGYLKSIKVPTGE